MGAFDVASSVAATALRFGAGGRVGELGPRPRQLLELYEFEDCPFCRKVREALSILDLDVRIWPCPKGGPRYREELRRRAGKTQFPYLVDPNTGEEMYESSVIVRHLFDRYGRGRPPTVLSLGPVTILSGSLASLLRGARGTRYRPAVAPRQPLHLYGHEASPACRGVRETLCTLELPYVQHNLAAGGARVEAFVRRVGGELLPYLEDPNDGAALRGSAAIVRHLEDSYLEAPTARARVG